MTVNSDYAATLIKKFEPLPSVALKAVGRVVYTGVLNNTKQDSGEAAFNWRANINNAQVRPYLAQRGRAPVGSTGDQRSATMARFIVINHRLNDFLFRLRGKKVQSIFIYNPIDDFEHETRARVEEAQALSTGQDEMDGAAELAVRAAERGDRAFI